MEWKFSKVFRYLLKIRSKNIPMQKFISLTQTQIFTHKEKLIKEKQVLHKNINKIFINFNYYTKKAVL